jgi:hypothetical protein
MSARPPDFMHEPTRTVGLGGNPALAVASARAWPCCGRVSPDSDRPAAFATMTAPASPALASAACARPALARSALARYALTGPELSSPALTRPALAGPALVSPALARPALASPALAMTMMPAWPYRCRRVSLAGTGARPPAFATVSAPLPVTAYDSKEHRGRCGPCASPSTRGVYIADGVLIHRGCSVGSGKRAGVDRHRPRLRGGDPHRGSCDVGWANA